MKLPKLTPVESSNIQSMGHDAQHGLVVRFKGGGLYSYPEVSKDTYEAGVKAESVGRWFGATIRGHYKHAQLDA